MPSRNDAVHLLVILFLTAFGFQQPAWANDPPVANAGADQTVTIGDTVYLDGSQSSDPENSALTYNWWIHSPSTNKPGISGWNTVSASFVPNGPGPYEVRLKVTDPQGLESTADSTAITIVYDSDGDGVVNSADQCANTPQGATVDANGCIVVGSPYHHPGHYAFLRAPDTTPEALADAIDDINALVSSGDKAFKGFAIRIPWATLEPAEGQYDFTLIDTALNHLDINGSYPQTLMVMIEDTSFVDGEHKVPDYMQIEEYYESISSGNTYIYAKKADSIYHWRVPDHCTSYVIQSGSYELLKTDQYQDWASFTSSASIKWEQDSITASSADQSTDPEGINCGWFANLDIPVVKPSGATLYTGLRYNTYYNNRLVALVDALAQQYANHPGFEGLAFQETTLGFSNSPVAPAGQPSQEFILPADEDCTQTSPQDGTTCRLKWILDYRDKIVNLMQQSATKFPHKAVFFYMNYLPYQAGFSAPSLLVETIEAIVGSDGSLNAPVVVGGPDSFPYSHNSSFVKDDSLKDLVYDQVYSEIYHSVTGALRDRPGFSSAQEDSFRYYCDPVRLFKFGIGMSDTHNLSPASPIRSKYFFWTYSKVTSWPLLLEDIFDEVVSKSSFENGDWTGVSSLTDATGCSL